MIKARRRTNKHAAIYTFLFGSSTGHHFGCPSELRELTTRLTIGYSGCVLQIHWILFIKLKHIDFARVNGMTSQISLKRSSTSVNLGLIKKV